MRGGGIPLHAQLAQRNEVWLIIGGMSAAGRQLRWPSNVSFDTTRPVKARIAWLPSNERSGS